MPKSYNKHDFGVKNPIASGGLSPDPCIRDTLLCSDPLSENPGSAPASTSGGTLKLFKSRSSCCVCSNFFSSHVVNDWNSLPDYVINAPTISTFKEQPDYHWNSCLFCTILTIS